MEARDEIKKRLASGGLELDVFFGVWEGMMRTSAFMRDDFKAGWKTVRLMTPVPEMAIFATMMEGMILDMEADAFADAPPIHFPVIGCPSGLEDPEPRPMLPRFLKTREGEIVNVNRIDRVWLTPKGNTCSSYSAWIVVGGDSLVGIMADELETLIAILDQETLPLGPSEAVPAEQVEPGPSVDRQRGER